MNRQHPSSKGSQDSKALTCLGTATRAGASRLHYGKPKPTRRPWTPVARTNRRSGCSRNSLLRRRPGNNSKFCCKSDLSKFDYIKEKPKMSTEQNKKIAERLPLEISKGNMAVFD